MFGADISSLVHIDDKKKDIFTLLKGPTDGLNDTTLAAEIECSITFTNQHKNFCFGLHYNEVNGYLFVNSV